jgi:transcriptional regulator with XRE-family HTH domain
LLDDVSRFGSRRESQVPTFLTHVASLLFDGNFAALAKHLGLSKSQVHGWMHKGILPSLNAVARIAYAFDCRIADVLLGNQPPVRLREGFNLPRGVFGLKRNTGHRVPHQKLLDSLSAFMSNNPNACAQEAANYLETSTKFLRKNFPVQNLALVHDGRLHRQHMAQLRKNAKELAYQQSYLALAESGVYPCRRKVMQRLREKGVSLTFAEESRATKLGFVGLNMDN